MQTHHVKLESVVSDSFRCRMAANSLDIDTKKKSTHELKVEIEIESEYQVGLIVGASGSGKTTLAKELFGLNCFKSKIKQDVCILDQLPESLTYDECAEILNSIGLSQVVCWIRPVNTLSNGQKARAEAALLITNAEGIVIIDEWTSVVDRTVAKVMSHCVQKFARRQKKKIVLCSCHYDVTEWLDPDWIIDCNKALFTDRRSLSLKERERKEKLNFEIKKVERSTWPYFSKYHYLSEKLPGGTLHLFGLFHENDQIGFQCFANYVPKNKSKKLIFHSNRTVIHPDYCGLGLGVKLINESSLFMMRNFNYKIMAKFSSTPVYKAFVRHAHLWKLCNIDRQIGRTSAVQMGRTLSHRNKNAESTGFRENVKTYSFEFIGK